VSLAEGLFRDIRRSNASLAELGLDRDVLEPALADVATLDQTDLDHRPDSEIAAALVDAYWHPPRLGEVRRGERVQGHDHVDRAGVGSAVGIPFRHSLRVPLEWEVTGDAHWLMWWPDATTQEPVDVVFPFPELTNEVDKAEWNRRTELSSNLFLLTDSKVSSFIEVPVNPDDSLDAGTLVRQAIHDRDALLRGYVDAIEPTVEHERSRVLTTVTSAVQRRRAELAWFDAVDEALTLFPESVALETTVPARPTGSDRDDQELDVLPQITEASFDAIVAHILR
jgi:hypothetical protein